MSKFLTQLLEREEKKKTNKPSATPSQTSLLTTTAITTTTSNPIPPSSPRSVVSLTSPPAAPTASSASSIPIHPTTTQVIQLAPIGRPIVLPDGHPLAQPIPPTLPVSGVLDAYPKWGVPNTTESVPASASSSSSSSTTNPPATVTTPCTNNNNGEDPSRIPGPEKHTRDYIQKCFDRLPRIEIIPIGGLATAGTARDPLIRSGHTDIPVSLAEHESRLLYASGVQRCMIDRTRRIIHERKFPPCVHMDKCIGRTWKDIQYYELYGNKTLCAYMTPKELDTFLQDGTLPSHIQEMPCVLCHRFDVATMIVTIRGQLPVQLPKNTHTIQLWYNRINQIGGYNRDCSIEKNGMFEGMIGPMAVCRINRMRWAQDPITAQCYIDQSAMIYQPNGAASAYVGETLENF